MRHLNIADDDETQPRQTLQIFFPFSNPLPPSLPFTTTSFFFLFSLSSFFRHSFSFCFYSCSFSLSSLLFRSIKKLSSLSLSLFFLQFYIILFFFILYIYFSFSLLVLLRVSLNSYSIFSFFSSFFHLFSSFSLFLSLFLFAFSLLLTLLFNKKIIFFLSLGIFSVRNLIHE